MEHNAVSNYRGYWLDCTPVERRGGRYQPRLKVHRRIESPPVWQDAFPLVQEYPTAKEAIDHAAAVGRRWIKRRG